MKTDKKKVVTVMSFNSVLETQLYKALLESAGVVARMENDIAAQIYPFMTVSLLVAGEDEAKAREILSAKFDIDEFHRQANGQDKNPVAKKKRSTEKDSKGGSGAKSKGEPAKKTTEKKVSSKSSATSAQKKAAPKESSTTATKKPATKKASAKK